MFYALFKTVLFLFRLIDLILITVFVFTLSLLPKFLVKPFIHKLFRLFCWSFIRFLGKSPHIHENFTPPLPKQYVLISNHPSGYDLVMINALFSVKPLAQAGVRKWFLVGRIAEATGTVFVYRENKNSRNAAKEACLKALEEGHSILIYPEGGCYGRDLTPFKLGAFDISFRTGVPILPVYLQYEAENAYEWGWEDNLVRHLFKLMTAINKHTHCHIFNPIYPDKFNSAVEYQEYVYSLYKNWQQRFKLLDIEENESVSYTGTALQNG